MVFQGRDGGSLGSAGGSGVGQKWTDLRLCLEGLVVTGCEVWDPLGFPLGKLVRIAPGFRDVQEDSH